MQPTGYHHQIIELVSGLVNHGFGEMTIRVVTPKGNTESRVEISCGKSYMFIIKRENKLDNIY